MNIKKQWVKPVMVTEQFSADQYVAICAEPSQYLYIDGIRYDSGYFEGSDGIFQAENNATEWWRILLRVLLFVITGRNFNTDGEYTGVHTIDNPSIKGEPFTFPNNSYPVYGSSTQLSNGAQYSGGDIGSKLKVIPKGQPGAGNIYIQGNMS